MTRPRFIYSKNCQGVDLLCSRNPKSPKKFGNSTSALGTLPILIIPKLTFRYLTKPVVDHRLTKTGLEQDRGMQVETHPDLLIPFETY